MSAEAGGEVLVTTTTEQPATENVGPAVEAEIEAVTSGVAELQGQIKQLQEQHRLAASENLNLLATLESERALHRQQPEVTMQNGHQENRVIELEQKLQERTEERESFKSQLAAAEKRVAELQAGAPMDLTDNAERNAVQETLEKLTATLKEQTGQCERFERQNTQLQSQVKALKEVISVHKDLLAIRSLESDQLKTTIKLLEEHAKAEKDRRSAVLAKMESAVRLNGELKTEYENQLRIFQDLKGKYEQKLQLLKAENERLKELLPVPEQPIIIPQEEIAEQ